MKCVDETGKDRILTGSDAKAEHVVEQVVWTEMGSAGVQYYTRSV